jgi:CBS domain-containing protein
MPEAAMSTSTGFKVEDYMARQLVTVGPQATAAEAIGLLLKHEISGMPVVDEDGALLGVLSERDCLKPLVDAQYYELPTTPVKELMSTDLQTVSPQTDIMKVAELFLNNRYRRLPVLDEGRVVGQISRRDVLRAVREVHRLV